MIAMNCRFLVDYSSLRFSVEIASCAVRSLVYCQVAVRSAATHWHRTNTKDRGFVRYLPGYAITQIDWYIFDGYPRSVELTGVWTVIQLIWMSMLARWCTGYGVRLATRRSWVRFPAVAAKTGICNRLRAEKPSQYFAEPLRPTQPPTLIGTEMRTGHSAVTICHSTAGE